MNKIDGTSTTILSERENKRQLTVMVIDDERDVRDSVCEMLEVRGYNVICAEDGRAALDQLLGGRQPDVILLDLMMPGMNGWQFREEQSRDPRLALIPVVVISATRNLREIQVEEIVHKPIKPDQLLRVVERWGAGEKARGRPRAVPGPGAAEAAAGITAVARPSHAPPRRTAQVDRTALFSERFIEMLGHDLRNPLSAISITGGLLSHHAKTPEISEPTTRILAIVDRMDLAIGQLMDFLRICLGHEMPLERRRANLRDICEHVVKVLSPVGRKINVVVTGEMDGLWDRDRLHMLLSTLVTDAFDRDASGDAVEIQLDGSGAEQVRLQVSHRGIHAEDLLSRAVDAREGGERSVIEEQCTRLGLGMYVAQQIVLAHGGEIQTSSEASTGTRFHITLPRDTAR